MATIITKNSSTASAVPSAGSLTKGELAVNVTDKKLYTKDNSGNVVVVGQEPLISGTNIKTVDGNSILGSGDIDFKTVAGQVVSGTGNIDVVTPGAVTTSNLTMATNRLLGRTSASTGAIEEISVGSGLTFSGGSLSNSAFLFPRLINTSSTSNGGTTSTTLVISTPSGIVSGDFLICFLASDNNVSWTGDTGWTETADNNRIRVAYKIATGAEPASYTFTADTAQKLSGHIVAIRNVAYDTTGTVGTGASGDAGAVTPSDYHGFLFSFFVSTSGSTTIAAPSIIFETLVSDVDSQAPSTAVFIKPVLVKQSTGILSTATSLGAAGRAVTIAVKPA